MNDFGQVTGVTPEQYIHGTLGFIPNDAHLVGELTQLAGSKPLVLSPGSLQDYHRLARGRKQEGAPWQQLRLVYRSAIGGAMLVARSCNDRQVGSLIESMPFIETDFDSVGASTLLMAYSGDPNDFGQFVLSDVPPRGAPSFRLHRRALEVLLFSNKPRTAPSDMALAGAMWGAFAACQAVYTLMDLDRDLPIIDTPISAHPRRDLFALAGMYEVIRTHPHFREIMDNFGVSPMKGVTPQVYLAKLSHSLEAVTGVQLKVGDLA